MKIIRSLLLMIVFVFATVFAIVNRSSVSLDLFPLPYTIELPKFLFAVFCVMLGALLGWLMSGLSLSKRYFQFRSEHKRVQALENELRALKNDALILHRE